MERFNWTVSLPTLQVKEAAENEATYHRNREKHWNGERLNAENELREHGVELRSHEVTGGKNVTAVLDPERAKHLADCENKVRTHQALAEGYESWVGFLNSGVGLEEMRTLDQSDVEYFWPAGTYSEEV